MCQWDQQEGLKNLLPYIIFPLTRSSSRVESQELKGLFGSVPWDALPNIWSLTQLGCSFGWKPKKLVHPHPHNSLSSICSQLFGRAWGDKSWANYLACPSLARPTRAQTKQPLRAKVLSCPDLENPCETWLLATPSPPHVTATVNKR